MVERQYPKLNDYCFFCHGPRPHITEITESEMCDSHLAQMCEMAGEFFYSHPDGQCTPDCGCITLEELERRFGLNGRGVPAQDSPNGY